MIQGHADLLGKVNNPGTVLHQVALRDGWFCTWLSARLL
jgi:hypothetical protein